MKKLRLLCIPPYEGMFHLMSNIAAKRSDVELLIHPGNLEDGLKAMLEHRDKNINAVISRGGTAEIIRAHCGDIPVCNITPSVYDILRTIRLAQTMSEKFAVVGFPSITKSVDMLLDILQYDFEIKTIHSLAECEDCLHDLRSRGIRTIAGDMISVTCAQKLDMHGLLITSGIESVELAIDKAIDMCRCTASISRQAALLSDLLASGENDSLIYTSDGQLYYSTSDMLPSKITDLLQQKVPDVIAQGSLRIVRHINCDTLSIQGRLLRSDGEDYCAYTIARRADQTLFDKYRILYLSASSDLPDCKPMEYYLGNSAAITGILAACDRYASMNAPVLITGSHGTGKDRFAHYIYSHSRMKHSSFLVIDAALLDDRGWHFLLESENSPLTDSGLTIYFKRLNTLTHQLQQDFLIYLKNSRVIQANRLFFSYTFGQGNEPRDDLYLYLTETMRCMCLHTLPLAQRREDIPVLAGLYINAINVRYGTRVIGLTHDAMLVLQNHVWTRNVDQLEQVLQNLVINANSSYISEEDVRTVLSRKPEGNPAPPDTNIDLNQTLYEITRDIVLRVYESENMNQTHTAKRLGISRSTLWRMLK